MNYTTKSGGMLVGIAERTMRQYYENHGIGKKDGKAIMFSDDDIERIREIKTARWSKKEKGKSSHNQRRRVKGS